MPTQHAARRTVLIGAVLLAVATVGPAAAKGNQDGPGGNNGTVKIDGEPFDNHPGNEPHVGCAFGVDLYGYEADLPVTLTFSLQPPTGRDVVHVVDGVLDGDDASGGGSEAGHDGHFDVDLADALAGVAPHPVQGWHVALTVTVDDGDEQGAQVKHKVFWVESCGSPTTTTTTSTSSTTTTSTTTSTSTTTTTASTTTTTLGQS